jgi:hypothetical protein
LSLLTRPDLIPSPSPNIKNDAIKKKCAAHQLFISRISLNRTAANQIVPAEKKLHVAVQRNFGGWIQIEPMERWPQIIIFGYKDYAVSTKNGLQLAKHEARKWQTEAQQLPTLFDIWSCTKNAKSWLI